MTTPPDHSWTECPQSNSSPQTQYFCPWDFPGKNTGMGSHSLLQEIFLTQGLNSSLLHFRQILYHLSHQGSPANKWNVPTHMTLSEAQIISTSHSALGDWQSDRTTVRGEFGERMVLKRWMKKRNLLSGPQIGSLKQWRRFETVVSWRQW